MKSSISADTASPSIARPTRCYTVLLADGSRLRVTCRDLAAQLRQERSATLKRLRQARSEAKAEVADRIGEARIRRELEASEREMDAAIRRLSKQVRVKSEPRRSASPRPTRVSRPRPIGTGHSGITVTRSTTSGLARRDRLGREGIMVRIRYVRAGGKHAGPGCLRRHWRYIAREAAVTLDSDGRQIVLSNLGHDIDEVADALGLQEQLLREMRKNAKLGFRMVGAFPYGMPVDARREVLQRLGDELFGSRGLPWSAAAHDADPGANVDNPHFHLDYGLLPMARQADGSFIVSNDLRTDLDGQEGLRFIRHTVARVLTEVAQEHGLDRTFTALSYRERGMEREGGEHVGQEGTAAHRRGEHVASIARNAAKERLAGAREKARLARDRLEALQRLKRTIEATKAAPHVDGVSTAAIMGTGMTAAVPVIAYPASPIGTLPADAAPITERAPRTAVFDEAPLMDVVPSSGVADIPEAPAFPRPSIRPVMPPAAPETLTPTINQTATAAPTMEPSPPSLYVPPAPSIVSLSSLTVVLSPIEGKATKMTTMPPAVVALVEEARPADLPPAVAAVGSEAPDLPTPVKIADIGAPVPRTVAPVVPHADIRLAPVSKAVRTLETVLASEAPAMAVPPAVTRLGSPAPRLMALPSLWHIGRQAADDAADRGTAKRIEQLLEEEEERRRTGVAAQPDVNVAHAAAFEALRLRDEWLPQDERGRYVVPDDALRAIGLSQADLDTPAGQAALKAMGSDQLERLGPVIDDVSPHLPFHLEDGAIHLDDRFGASLRGDVERWGADPNFRAFVGEVWPSLKPALEAQPAPPAYPAATGQDRREHALTALFTAIAEERHFLTKAKDGPVVDPMLLKRFGLVPADLAGEDAGKRLAGIAEQQTIEVSQIATYVRQAPHHIVADGEGWLLDAAAPAEIRTVIAAWRNDATIQQALGRVGGTRPVEAPPAAMRPNDQVISATALPGAAWRRGRAMRERAMVEGDAAERSDDNGLPQPCRRIERPGQTRPTSAIAAAWAQGLKGTGLV